MEEDRDLSRQLQELARNGQTKPLSELVGGDWDTVHLFLTVASTRDTVEEAVGQPIDMPDFSMSEDDLFVFVRGGEVIRAVRTTPELFGAEGRYGDAVVVRGSTNPHEFLKLVEAP